MHHLDVMHINSMHATLLRHFPFVQDTVLLGLTLSTSTLQTLMYACQRMDNDKQLQEYHVPPVSVFYWQLHTGYAV